MIPCSALIRFVAFLVNTWYYFYNGNSPSHKNLYFVNVSYWLNTLPFAHTGI